MLSQDLVDKLFVELAATEASGVDPAAAVAFAAQFGDVNVMTFEEGRGDVHPNTGTSEAVVEFIMQRPDANLYFDPAIRSDSTLGKRKKADYIGSEWVWVDIDPPKNMIDPMALDEWARQTIEQVAPLDLPEPQIVVFSGRGLWFYWKLPFMHPAREVEAINRGLAERMGGDHVHSIDHVARLPFTRNRKTGRLARALHLADGSTMAGALPVAVRMEPATDEEVRPAELPPPQPIKSVDEFHEVLDGALSEEDRDRLKLAALDPAAANRTRSEPVNVSDRSAVMFSWVMSAIKAGLPPAVVRNCILSPALAPISAHILDTRKVASYARDRYAAWQIESALKKLGPIPQQTDGPPPDNEEPLPQLVSLTPIPDDLPQRPWLVDGLLMDGQVTMISGKGGEGKSLLALQLGAMVAIGVEFAWWKPREPRNVLLLNGEDDVDELRRRLAAACPTMSIEPSSLTERLFSLTARSLVLLERDLTDGKVKTTSLYSELQRIVRENSIGLIIIDPLVETHVNLDENSNGDMKELIVKLRAMARLARIPVLVVHHSRKGAVGGDQDGARGGSALVNACRTVITLERMTLEEHGRIHPAREKESYVRLAGAKSNYAGRIDTVGLSFSPGRSRTGIGRRRSLALLSVIWAARSMWEPGNIARHL